MGKKLSIAILMAMALLSSCGSGDFVPKPKGLNYIDLPEHTYQVLDDPRHPYVFEYSKHAIASDDTAGLVGEHWKKLYYPDFDAGVDITYKSLEGKEGMLEELVDESYRLTYKHAVKASGIEPYEVVTASGNPATVFKLQGSVPSVYQVITYDSTKHFLRAALYFPTATKNDSLAPVAQFIVEDIDHLVNTLKWRDSTGNP